MQTNTDNNLISFDAIFHAFKFTHGVEQCLQSINEFHPSASIYIGVDGDGEYDKFVENASKYNIKKVVKYEENILPKARFDKPTSPKIYCNRILSLISLCTKKWIMLLEDDVRVVKSITELPTTDAGGPHGHALSEDLVFNIEHYTKQKLQNSNYGFCGGTIFKADIFNGLQLNKLNFEQLIKLDDRIGVATDICLTTLTYLNKKTYSHWIEYGELNNPSEANEHCSVLHNVK